MCLQDMVDFAAISVAVGLVVFAIWGHYARSKKDKGGMGRGLRTNGSTSDVSSISN